MPKDGEAVVVGLANPEEMGPELVVLVPRSENGGADVVVCPPRVLVCVWAGLSKNNFFVAEASPPVGAVRPEKNPPPPVDADGF